MGVDHSQFKSDSTLSTASPDADDYVLLQHTYTFPDGV